MKWYLVALKNYAKFSGRATRREYWVFALINIAVYFAFEFLKPSAYATIAQLVFLLAVLVPSVSASVRRLHDSGKSGAWVLITVVPLIGPIVMLVLASQEGTEGPNRFGPDPRRRNDSEHASGALV